MRSAYLDYAMSVITARALPDVRDGLKPVQRRILYAMNELGLSHTSAYKKSARIVGEVLGKYHPHGDAPVYETMVRMAQDFSLRYMLVDGQGNFGSVDGDPPAAMRYTEARLAAVAEEILADLDKNTVDFVDNFDATLKEPSVLPARLPNLLVNGASGIAVGMATNIPPHNLTEVADALIFILDQFQRAVDAGVPFDLAQARVHGRPAERETVLALRKQLSQEFKDLVAREYEARLATLERAPKNKEQREGLEYDALLETIDQTVDVPVERLSHFVAGPDFPTGGIIVGRKGVTDAYMTGHGRIVIRAKVFVEDRSGDRSTIVITELPYQVNKATLVERIADLVRDKRIEGVSELRDESDRQGMRVVIELRRDVPARQILNNLFKLTAMQSAFSVNLLALVDGEPRVLNLKRLLQHYIDYRLQVITRRTQFDLDKARARAHILEGLKIALDNLDEVISTIRNSPDADTARTRLMKKFKLSELQAQAILDMQLRRLAALERKKIEQELADTLKQIAQLEDLLAHPIKMYGLIKQDLLELKEKYGDARRTKILDEEAEDFTAEDLIPDEDVMVAVSARGYVKRSPADQWRAQARRSSARAVSAVISKEQDPVIQLLPANTHDSILFFSNTGKVFGMKCHEIPAGDRQARGVPLNNFLSTTAEEKIVGMAAIREQNGGSVTLITRKGEMKRVAESEMVGVRPSGINVMALSAKDEVVWAGHTKPNDEIVIVTARGQAIRFAPETEARASGRGSGGVRAIRLDDDDTVAAVDLVERDGALIVLSTLGWGKRTDMKEYSAQGRGGGGIMTFTATAKNGPLAAARALTPGDELMIVSTQGMVVRKSFDDVAAQARAGRGAVLAEWETGDKTLALLRLRPDKKSPVQPGLPESDATPAPARKKRAAPETPEAARPAPAKAEQAVEIETTPAKAEKAAATPAKATAKPAPAKAEKPAAEKAAATPAKATAKPTPAKAEKPAARKAAATPAKAIAKPTPAKAEKPAAKKAAVTPAKTTAKPTSAKSEKPASLKAEKTAEIKPVLTRAEKPAAIAISGEAAQAASAAGASDSSEPSRVPPPSPVRTAKPAQPAAPSSKERPARHAGAPAPEARPQRPAKRDNGIVVRSGGKVTVIPRATITGEAPEQAAPHKDKREPAKGDRQIPLPLWGDEPKKRQ
jgi:DNA gyrase subunit A